MNEIKIQRLAAGGADLAAETFAVMAQAFEEERAPLRPAYLNHLLQRPDFWAWTALAAGRVVGGLTAFTLPMTRAETSELMIYDLAVSEGFRRRGVGRALVEEACRAAAAAGVPVAFVLADNEDVHALDFYRALGGQAMAVTSFTLGGE